LPSAKPQQPPGLRFSRDLKIVYEPLPQDDPTQRQPDITKAKEILGWQPKVSLDEGLPKTVEYFRGL
jgi:dTDP-glucose 4,6-dehydratase